MLIVEIRLKHLKFHEQNKFVTATKKKKNVAHKLFFLKNINSAEILVHETQSFLYEKFEDLHT